MVYTIVAPTLVEKLEQRPAPGHPIDRCCSHRQTLQPRRCASPSGLELNHRPWQVGSKSGELTGPPAAWIQKQRRNTGPSTKKSSNCRPRTQNPCFYGSFGQICHRKIIFEAIGLRESLRHKPWLFPENIQVSGPFLHPILRNMAMKYHNFIHIYIYIYIYIHIYICVCRVIMMIKTKTITINWESGFSSTWCQPCCESHPVAEHWTCRARSSATKKKNAGCNGGSTRHVHGCFKFNHIHKSNKNVRCFDSDRHVHRCAQDVKI